MPVVGGALVLVRGVVVWRRREVLVKVPMRGFAQKGAVCCAVKVLWWLPSLLVLQGSPGGVASAVVVVKVLVRVLFGVLKVLRPVAADACLPMQSGCGRGAVVDLSQGAVWRAGCGAQTAPTKRCQHPPMRVSFKRRQVYHVPQLALALDILLDKASVGPGFLMFNTRCSNNFLLFYLSRRLGVCLDKACQP